MNTLKNQLPIHQRVLELVNPVTWLRANTSFDPWPYEAELLRDSHLRTRVVRKSRQVGITTTIAHEAVWKAYTMNKRVILIVSPSQRQSGIVMSKIRAIVNANPRLSTLVARSTNTELHLKNGSMIAATPNNPDRIRGYTATDIYLDEAAHFLNDEPVMAAIRPMLIATKGTITIVSTPFGKRGLFWDQYRIASNRQGNADSKAYDFYPSTRSPLISQADLEHERLNHTDLEFRQEYLGEFIEAVDVYYPLDIILPCVDPTLKQLENGEEGGRYLMGIDFAKKRDETVVIIVEETKDHTLIIRYIAAWSGMDYTQQIGRIAQLASRFRIQRTVADKTGVGEALIEDLKRVVPNVEGVVFSLNSKADMATRLRCLFEQKQIRIPDDKKLINQLTSLRYEVTKIGNIVLASPEKEGLHDDYVWALAMACHTEKYPPLDYFTF